MSKPRVAVVIFVDILLLISLFLIYQIDLLVNGTLYYYGLVFDIGWAQPYSLLSKLSAIGIIAAMIFITSAELPLSAFEDKN